MNISELIDVLERYFLPLSIDKVELEEGVVTTVLLVHYERFVAILDIIWVSFVASSDALTDIVIGVWRVAGVNTIVFIRAILGVIIVL